MHFPLSNQKQTEFQSKSQNKNPTLLFKKQTKNFGQFIFFSFFCFCSFSVDPVQLRTRRQYFNWKWNKAGHTFMKIQGEINEQRPLHHFWNIISALGEAAAPILISNAPRLNEEYCVGRITRRGKIHQQDYCTGGTVWETEYVGFKKNQNKTN